MSLYASTQRMLLLLVISFILIDKVSSSNQRLPEKREYDSHHYYVLELQSESIYSPQEIALNLGAEHVEQVGELANHYLIRAPKGLIKQTTEPELLKRTIIQTDLVMERYELLKREKKLLGSRSIGLESSIISLEPQILRQRIKRQFIVPPPRVYGSGYQRRSIPLRSPIVRQIAVTPPVIPSLIVEMARRFEIEDPLFYKQWHINNAVMQENMVNVTGVWAQGIFGKGINVAIVDDGLDMHSDDLKDNFVR